MECPNNNHDHKPEQLSRRKVLRTTSQAVVATSLCGASVWAKPAAQSQPAVELKNVPTLPFGILGKTKYPATLISMGAILLEERQGSRVLRMAVDAGVNLVHTSASYGNGKSLQAVRGYLGMDKKNRDKVFLCLKSFYPENESEIDEMLAVLGTDHADAVITTFHENDEKRLDAIRKQHESLKKKGKARYAGFVCHKEMNGVIEMVLDKAPDFFDVALLAMRMVPIPGKKVEAAEAEQSERFMKNLKALKAKKVGILSMKSGARKAVTEGPKVFEPHAKMYLEAGADTVLTSIDTFDQVDMVRNLALKTTHPSFREKQAAADFLRENASPCLMCGECTKACPNRVPVADVMRMRMYDAEYGWNEHARNEFASIASAVQVCGDCGTCAKVCPVRLANPALIREVAASLRA